MVLPSLRAGLAEPPSPDTRILEWDEWEEIDDPRVESFIHWSRPSRDLVKSEADPVALSGPFNFVPKHHSPLTPSPGNAALTINPRLLRRSNVLTSPPPLFPDSPRSSNFPTYIHRANGRTVFKHPLNSMISGAQGPAITTTTQSYWNHPASRTAHLPTPFDMPSEVDGNHGGISGSAAENGRTSNSQDVSEDAQVADIDHYGVIETPDSYYLITTRTVVLGRDLPAFKRFKAEHQYNQRVADHAARGLEAPTPPKSLRKRKNQQTPSSQGGLLYEEQMQNPVKKRKLITSGDPVDEYHAYAEEHEDHTAGSVPVDMKKHRPKKDAIGWLSIHGQGPKYFETTKGISRKHLKIQYNFEQRVWEAHGLGRNGFFCENELVQTGQKITLVSGAQLQIQNVPMIFTLQGVDLGKTGADAAYSENGKAMSFDFTKTHHGQAESSDEEMDDAASVRGGKESYSHHVRSGSKTTPPGQAKSSLRRTKDAQSDSEDDDENDYGEEDDYDDIRETVEKQEQSPFDGDQLSQVPFAPRKRGPGRPPKNGVMSKREEKLLKKAQQDEAKKNLPPQDPSEPAQKRKVGRPRKHPLPDGQEDSSDKRPYKSRKKGEDGTEDPEGDKPAKEKSQKHKTPPLELRREDYEDKDLVKPTMNYQMMIDTIMSAAPEQGYSLKQIYKRIQLKWPHFYFMVDTKGWESSVRHNLLGSECFQKVDGNWHRVPGVPLDAGKKRKPSDANADSRPAMYNGYSQPPYQYQQPGQSGQPHGHQSVSHSMGSMGLGQPNLPPRYPPNGQAYQIQQGPQPSPNPPGGPVHPHGPPPSTFSQQRLPPTNTANPHVPAGPPPRPQYPGPQPSAHNQALGNRPQPPQPMMHGHGLGAIPNPAQRPQMARPGLAASPPQNLPVSHAVPAPSMGSSGGPSGPQHFQPAPVPLQPIVEPSLRDALVEFRRGLVKSLENKKVARAEAIAMSVISRGLKLTDRCLVPEFELVEKRLLPLFQKEKMAYLERRKDANAASSNRAQTVSQVNSQANRAGITNEAGTGGGSLAPSTTRELSKAGTAPSKQTPTSSTPTGGPMQSPPVSAPSNPATPVPTAPASTARPPTGLASGQSSNMDPTAPGLPSAVDKVQNAPTDAKVATPNPTSMSPAPINASDSLSGKVAKPVSASPAGLNTGAVAPSATPVTAPQDASAAHRAATSGPPSTVASAQTVKTPPTSSESGAAPRAIAAGPSAPRSTSAAPPQGSSAAVSSTAPGVATAASASAVSVNGGVSRLSSLTPAPAANGANPSASRATPATPGTPATPSAGDHIQLLEPKLVEVIMNFKRSIMSTLAQKLGPQLSECLILSAVHRNLGFSENTFVHSKTPIEKKNYAEAEKTLMQHLEKRFQQYRETRAKSKTSTR